MNHHDSSFCERPCNSLLIHDRRSDARRRCSADVWVLDDELTCVTQCALAIDISRGGIALCLCEADAVAVESLVRGREWLVIIDDPSGLEPLARDRTAIIRLLRADRDAQGCIRLACAFAARQVGRCLPARGSARRLPVPLSDCVAGDALDELADRLARELAAQERAIES